MYPFSFNIYRMPNLPEDPDHWRRRATEVRVIAEQMDDPKERLAMQRSADRYDLLALRAEQRKRPGDNNEN
jgi:hypothetical protein